MTPIIIGTFIGASIALFVLALFSVNRGDDFNWPANSILIRQLKVNRKPEHGSVPKAPVPQIKEAATGIGAVSIG
jgi:hypothetical protein